MRMLHRFIFIALFCTGLSITLIQSFAQETLPKPVVVLTMKGAVSPAYSEYLAQGLSAAKDRNAQLVVLKLNTPGGLLTSTRDMVTDILESPVPVAVWVTPSGAHAASAGTFLLYAAHIAAMDEGTNVGAATPIQMGGPQIPNEQPANEEENTEQSASSPTDQKALEDTSAFIRSLAELRGRNAEWAEKAVTEADSLTAQEALEKKVIDVMATSLLDLMQQIDGREIETKDKTVHMLTLADAPVEEIEPDWRTLLLALITDPNVALILMTIGIYGLILEFYNPGTMIPGTIGILSLAAALFAINVLPVNIAGVILIVLGIVFMIAEAFIPSFGILGLGGVAAFIFGATMLFDEQYMPGLGLDWEVIALLAAFGIATSLFIMFFAIKVMRKRPDTGTEAMIGQSAKIDHWSGQKGRVFIDGEHWAARSEDMLSGDEKTVIIEKIDGLTLWVKAEK